MSLNEFSDSDTEFMARAVELARQGAYTTTPNPCVGSVIVLDGKIVGEGWHQKAGTAQRVIFAMQDPNEKVAGSGAKILRDAGIAVGEGLLKQQAQALNLGYIKRMQQGIPRVRLKIASSLDGRIAMASGESQWITGELARSDVQKLRARSCAIVVGVNTILHDNPRYSLRENQLGEPVLRQPDVWICDSQLRAEPSLEIFQTARKLDRKVVIWTTELALEKQSHKQAVFADLGVEVLGSAGQDSDANTECKQTDLKRLLQLLGQREINEVLVEAGSGLSSAFLKQTLVDELIWYMAPKILGASAKPVFDMQIDQLNDAVGLQLQSREMIGEDLKLVLFYTE